MKNLFCNKSMKRLLSCLMVFGMLVCMMPATYAAETIDDKMTIISASDYTSDKYSNPAREFQKMFYNSYGHNLGDFNQRYEYVMFFRTSAEITYEGATHSIKWDEMNKYGLPEYTADSLAYGSNASNIANAWKNGPVKGYYVNTWINDNTPNAIRGIKRNVMMSKRDKNNPDYELSKYKYINFVIYSENATKNSFNVTLGKTDDSGTSTQKFTSTNAFSIDWEGKWKTISVPVESFEAMNTKGENTGFDITDKSQNAANYFILTNTNPTPDTTLYIHEVYMSVESEPAVTETTYGVPSCSDTAVTTTVINKSTEAISCVLVAAVYSAVDGQMEWVDYEEVTIQSGVEKGITVPVVNGTGKIVKGFLWESLGTLKPLTPSASHPVD